MRIRRLPAIVFGLLAAIIAGGGGAGCAQTKAIEIATNPPGATLTIDRTNRVRAPVRQEFGFTSDRDFHTVTAERQGYKDKTITIDKYEKQSRIVIKLDPLERDLVFTTNVPANFSIDGQRVTREPTTFFEAKNVKLGIDPKTNVWTEHTVIADAPGYQRAVQKVSWLDQVNQFPMTLRPLEKDVKVTTSPPGAQVYIDDKLVGTTAESAPAVAERVTFEMDDKGQFETHKLRAAKPGYDPVEIDISWDDGAKEYHVELVAKTKTVKIASEPPGAAIKLDGKDLTTDASGVATSEKLPFVPDDKGQLPTFSGVATKSGDRDYQPTPFTIGWDNGQTMYTVKLKEIPTRPLPMLTATWTRGEDGWDVSPEVVATVSAKDRGEGAGVTPPVLLTRVPPKLPAGATLDAFAVSPDGRQLLFTVLMGAGKNDFHSQMYVIKTDGSPGLDIFSDGKSLDMTPTYSPGGESIFFASNRAGRRMSIWQVAATGTPPIIQKTGGDANDIAPSIDSDPQPKMYYESRIDARTEPRLFSAVLGTATRTDLTRIGGGEPHVSPRNDQVLFSSANEKTGKRDLFIVPATGGTAQKLTDTPDVDECNPVWDRDGSRIAFASDAGKDLDGRRNYDIWVIDMKDPKHPRQLTTNASRDDMPVWDPTGRSIFFRSNRGGEWGIWRMQVK